MSTESRSDHAPLITLADPATRPAAFAIPQDGYDLHTPWHRHDMHQLQYAFEGAIEVEDRQASYLLTRSLAAFIPAGVAHRTSLHRVHSGSILFSHDMVKAPGERVRIVEVPPLMRAMVLGAMRWPMNCVQDATCQAYFTALGHLCGEWIEREAPFHLPAAASLRPALLYTRAHLRDGDVLGACEAAGLSERTLRRRFQKELGMTWDEYRRRARLLAAAALLSDTALPVGEVAAEVGFESQSAFARAFKALTGSTPRAFRHH